MRAVCWAGVNQLTVERVPDPGIRNRQDAIVKVRQSVTCGSDLALLAGRPPVPEPGDVLGHEFLGEVVEVGPDVRRHAVGDRVVVSPGVSCGRCWYCRQGLFACCDNADPDPALTASAQGRAAGGCHGYTQTMGGSGSHAEYVRVPYADVAAVAVPDEVADDRALLASDAAPAAWMGAELGGVRPGHVVAVWGAGAVGQLAARAAVLLGAARVICVDRHDYRLGMVRRYAGAETVNRDREDVTAELLERSGGRGPDVCVEAVGMDPGRSWAAGRWSRMRRVLLPDPDPARAPDPATGAPPPTAPAVDAVSEAVGVCRRGGSVFVLGLPAGPAAGFPLDTVVANALTVRGARQHGPRYIPTVLARMARGELATEHLVTHRLPLEEAPHGYALFGRRRDGCVRAVFEPDRGPA